MNSAEISSRLLLADDTPAPTREEAKARKREIQFVLAGRREWKGKPLHPFGALRYWYFAEMIQRTGAKSGVGDGYLIFFVLSQPLRALETVLALCPRITRIQLKRLIVQEVEKRMENPQDVHLIDRLGAEVLDEVFQLKAVPEDDDDDDDAPPKGQDQLG